MLEYLLSPYDNLIYPDGHLPAFETLHLHHQVLLLYLEVLK